MTDAAEGAAIIPAGSIRGAPICFLCCGCDEWLETPVAADKDDGWTREASALARSYARSKGWHTYDRRPDELCLVPNYGEGPACRPYCPSCRSDPFTINGDAEDVSALRVHRSGSMDEAILVLPDVD